MRDTSQAIIGVLAALMSAVLVFGALTISLAEGGLQAALAPQQTPTITTPLPTQQPGEPTYTPSPTPLPTSTPTLVISDICAYPDGWIKVVVDFGDDISSLASRYNMSVEELRQSNCLDMRALMPGMTVFVPAALPTATIAASATLAVPPTKPQATRVVVCSRPYGWVIYVVRPGDTLSRISRMYGVTVQLLMDRNCLRTTTIRVGQRLYVPNVPPLPPTFTPVPYISPTLPAPTYTPVANTATWVPPSSTPVTLPTNTAPPPTWTNTPPAATHTATSPAPTIAPTTAVPPSATPVPSTWTPAPLPSATSPVVPPPVITRTPFITPTGGTLLITRTP